MIEDIRWKRVGKEIDQIALEGTNEAVLVIAAGGFVCKLQTLKGGEWVDVPIHNEQE